MLTGVEAIYGCPLKVDEKGSVQYDLDKLVKVCDTIEADVKKKYGSAKQYASNTVKKNIKRLIEVTLEINTDDILLDIEAMLQGYVVEKGGYTETTQAKEVYFAYMIKAAVDETSHVYITLYKGIAELDGEKFKTEKENVEFTTRKLKITCIANADGKVMDKRRSDAADFEEAVKTEWNKYPYGYKPKA